MSRSIKDNEVLSPLHQILLNAVLIGTHKNKKFLTKLFNSNKICIKGTLGIDATTKIKIIEDFFKILDLFEEKYKGQADLGFHFDQQIGVFIPYFKVLYPKFTITNSQGKSHEIRDLFVYHSFKWTNGAVHPYKLEGGRLSKTDLEVTSSYQQSHLGSHSSWKSNPLYCSYFCIGGDTDVSRMLAEFEVDMDIDRYELFLFCVDSMITWESLEGVPFIRMEVVKSANNLRVAGSNSNYETTLYEAILSGKIPLDVDFYIADGIYRIHPNLRASEFIKKLVLRKFTFDKYKSILVTRQANTFDSYLQMRPEGAIATGFNKITATEEYTIFRGRKIYPRIIREDRRNQKPISIEEYIVYPKFLENVIRKLESRIYEKAVVKSATKIHNFSNNAYRGVTSDTVSV